MLKKPLRACLSSEKTQKELNVKNHKGNAWISICLAKVAGGGSSLDQNEKSSVEAGKWWCFAVGNALGTAKTGINA